MCIRPTSWSAAETTRIGAAGNARAAGVAVLRRAVARLWIVVAIAATTPGCVGTGAPVEDDNAGPIYYPPPPAEPRFVHEFTLRRVADIELETETDRLRRQLTGDTSRDTPAFVKPFDVAARNGRLYVTDSMAGLVHAFDVPRRSYWRMGYRFEGELSKPAGVSIDRRGFVYVADTGRRQVLVFDGLGLYQRTIGGESELSRPVAAAANSDGSRIYVVDAGGVESQRHRIEVFDGTGQHLATIGRRGSEPGEFNLPSDIAVAPNGELYVLDSGNFRVQVLTPEGTPLRHWGSVGNQYGQFARPRSIAVSDDGLVYVGDTMFGNVQIFDDRGALLLPIGSGSEQDTPGGFGLLAGIDVDETGRLYAVDQLHRKVEIFRFLD